MNSDMLKKATFGAGCFWGVEHSFRQLEGVVNTVVGFMGGTVADASYKEVCKGATGHAEVVQIEFDPEKISYNELLAHFWELHDPTMPHQDWHGGQYRSVVFFHSPEQEEEVKRMKLKLNESNRFPRPILTDIEPVQEFSKAEEYHQQYYEKTGLASCHV